MAEQISSFSVKSFYDFLGKKKLMGVKCLKCNFIFTPPRPTCPHCESSKLTWIELSGKGKIATYTVIHVGSSELSSETPYIIGVVGLDEGPKVSCRLTGMDPSKPDIIKIGCPMTVDFIFKGEKVALAFRPAA
jgi:uncharacterized OB-fold protein